MKNHIAPNNDNNIPNKVNVFSEVSPVLGKILDEVSSIFIFSVFPLILLFRTILFELLSDESISGTDGISFSKTVTVTVLDTPLNS